MSALSTVMVQPAEWHSMDRTSIQPSVYTNMYFHGMHSVHVHAASVTDKKSDSTCLCIHWAA
jgi:hypothetical protein